MKYVILISFLIGGALTIQAQEKKPSLKDLLFSGKLKKDSTGVIRSTDDLSQKIDTSTKKETQSVAATTATASPTNVQPDKAAVNSQVGVTTTSVAATGLDPATTKVDSAVAAAATTAPAKSNTKLLREYTDSLVKALQEGPIKAKQIKKDTYYVMLDYEIDTDGKVTFTNVTSTPENSFLQAQITQILDSTPLRLNPVTDSNNQGKKVKRKQQLTITKE